MFRAVGLDDADMKRWHAVFEERHPDGHQSFLEWLELGEERIAAIRRDARSSADSTGSAGSAGSAASD